MSRPRIRKPLIAALALALAVPMAGNALAGNKTYRALEGDRVLVVTYDAKPPYSHKIVKVKDLPPDELARFQATLARDAERVARKAEKAVRDGQVVAASEKKQGDQSPN